MRDGWRAYFRDGIGARFAIFSQYKAFFLDLGRFSLELVCLNVGHGFLGITRRKGPVDSFFVTALESKESGEGECPGIKVNDNWRTVLSIF